MAFKNINVKNVEKQAYWTTLMKVAYTLFKSKITWRSCTKLMKMRVSKQRRCEACDKEGWWIRLTYTHTTFLNICSSMNNMYTLCHKWSIQTFDTTCVHVISFISEQRWWSGVFIHGWTILVKMIRICYSHRWRWCMSFTSK